MANYITLDVFKVALSTFLDNLISWLPFTKGKSMNNTLKANNDGEVAFGYYNQSESDTIFSVGYGTQEEKSNAFEVKKDGSVYIIKEGGRVKLQDISGESMESISIDKINSLN